METSFSKSIREFSRAGQPRSVSEAILLFLQALELRDRQPQLVSSRIEAVENLAKGPRGLINVEKTLLIGSYARDSQIRPLANNPQVDVDLLLVLYNTNWNLSRFWKTKDGGTKLLQDLYLSLKNFSEATIRIDRPAISIRWAEMNMQIIPAFRNPKGGFLIPSKLLLSPKWQVTDPLADIEALSDADKACRERLFRPLVKFLKCWNRHNGSILSSFELETVAYHSAPTGYLGFEFEIPWFFEKLLEFDGSTISSPSGKGNAIRIELTTEQRKTIQSCHARAQQAFYEGKRNNHRLAISILSEIFGPPFPGAKLGHERMPFA